MYTEDEAKAMGFEAIPLCIHIGDLEGRDLQIDMEEFYRRIQEGQVPRSSQPPIGEVLDAYARYPQDEIVHISIAEGLSGTYHGACSAREMTENPERITVFNSRTLCGPHRYMTEQAQKMKEEGRSASEILEWLKEAAQKTESFLIPQDFSFLKRGGRLTPVAAALGSVLKLKPVMKLTEDGTRIDNFFGKAYHVCRCKRNYGVHETEGHRAEPYFIYCPCCGEKEAENIRTMFETAFAGLEIHILELSPVFVAQGGPKCVAIQYIHR